MPGRRNILRSGLFVTGLPLLLVGSGPLFTVMVLADLGFTRNPNPKPIGYGVLAGLTFWPGRVLMFVGIVKTVKQGCRGPA
jgi:hypothetical protein